MRVLRVVRYTGRVLGLSTAAGVVGGTVWILHKNNWNVSSLGFIRFGRAARSVAVCVSDYKWSLRPLEYGSEEYWRVKSQVHLRSAERLRDMCCVNGGTFIKVGQHLGALEYLLPKEYVETMKVLHSNAPQSPKQDLYQVIKEDLGKPVEEIFSSFEDSPLGTASLAQVHKATLLDGTVVAVKVQHPTVKAYSFIDMATMELLVHLVSWIIPEFNMIWLAEETKKNLPLELDFYHEAENCETIARVLKHCKYLKVPKIHWSLTTERVLTMEYCEGGQVNDRQYIKDNNISVNEISQKLGHLYSEMIFVHGYIHCDPHPGNVLVKQTPAGLQLVLLDHGLYQTLTDDFRLNYCKFWRCILEAKLDGIKKYSERIGIGRLYPLFACMVTARSWSAITKGVDKQNYSKEEEEEIQGNVASYLPQISDILNTVPRQMLLIFKANDLLRGIETHLQTRAMASSFITMSHACIRAIFQHKRHKCSTWRCVIRVSVQESYYRTLLYLYWVYLWYKDTMIGQYINWPKSGDILRRPLTSMIVEHGN